MEAEDQSEAPAVDDLAARRQLLPALLRAQELSRTENGADIGDKSRPILLLLYAGGMDVLHHLDYNRLGGRVALFVHRFCDLRIYNEPDGAESERYVLRNEVPTNTTLNGVGIDPQSGVLLVRYEMTGCRPVLFANAPSPEAQAELLKVAARGDLSRNGDPIAAAFLCMCQFGDRVVPNPLGESLPLPMAYSELGLPSQCMNEYTLRPWISAHGFWAGCIAGAWELAGALGINIDDATSLWLAMVVAPQLTPDRMSPDHRFLVNTLEVALRSPALAQSILFASLTNMRERLSDPTVLLWRWLSATTNIN